MQKSFDFPKHEFIRNSQNPFESGSGWGLFVFHKYFRVKLGFPLRVSNNISIFFRLDDNIQQGHIDLPDYKSVKALTIPELKKECKIHGIDTSLSKLALVNLLCQALKISTIGSRGEPNRNPCSTLNISRDQKAKYDLLTPLSVHKMKGWTKDTSGLPMLTDSDVKHYLLKTFVISKDYERSYKLSRPYMLMPNVHSCEMLQHDTFIIVRGLCNLSQLVKMM